MNSLRGEPDLVGQAIRLLPSCYNYELARCLELHEMSAHPDCAVFDQAYDRDFDRFDKVVDQLPVCPISWVKPWHFYAASAVAVALGVGCVMLARR